ncbi:response regulator [Blastococcus saxobsidens]|uniref:Two component response regulator receiver modulated diguanylate cyclase n=1 Tax=Blastococcus saxobsidens (strain DD2) TaxID=1146883 RepID=H6RP38_BLASD|nr:response regulator [Blastococcus saxobsidens]CCG02699.1 Two component response regulator receiver modulated diguanylate cyclase [Blastococcus saxobsidens DD2]
MTLAPQPPTPAAVTDSVAALWDRRKDDVMRRAVVFDDVVVALLNGELTEELRQQAAREAHKLAGSLGMFGLPEGSRVARELEHLFETATALDHRRVPQLSALTLELRRELERPAVPAAAPAVRGDRRGSDRGAVLVVDDDEDFAAGIAAVAASVGLREEVAGSPAAARLAIARRRPDLVLLDLGFPGGSDDALALLAELSAARLPVFALTVRDTFTDRVEVARRGAVGFLEKSLSPSQVIEAVLDQLERGNGTSATVLTVDDDSFVLDAVRALLTPQGLQVHTLDDPRRLFEVVDDISPDLLVLDFDMPHANGVELCRALRNNARWTALPVLFLTARADPGTVQAIFAAGGDDYLTKPVLAAEFLGRVMNRLERVRLLRQLADTDALTGVSTRRRSTEVLNRFIRTAQRFGQPLCLAVLDLDQFKSVNDRHGHTVGDEVLRRLGELLTETFRGEDITARWGGEEFVVGMYGMTRDDGVQRVAELLEKWRHEVFTSVAAAPFSLSFSAGVAQYPFDGTDVEALYRSADLALYQAKAQGRDRVVPAGAHHTDPTDIDVAMVDVALVEDDEVIAALILHSLATRGYSTCWLRDGDEAAASLTGPLSPRLVLLDWDLPGRNGLAVLAAMAEAGVLERTRTIMLTGRSTEEETLEALELGAIDHVAKPFSLPVLMQRVRRALAR